MNGAGLTTGSVAGSGAGGVAGLRGWRLVSTISWRRFGGLWKVTERDLMMRSWVDGEDVEAFSKDPFELVETRIISRDEGKVMGITGGSGGGVGVMESSE